MCGGGFALYTTRAFSRRGGKNLSTFFAIGIFVCEYQKKEKKFLLSEDLEMTERERERAMYTVKPV